METLQRLKNEPLFSHVSTIHMAQLVEISTRRSLHAGSWLFQQGQPGDGLYVIDRGRVVLLDGEGSNAEVLGTLGEGKSIGEEALLLGDDYPYSAQAGTSVELVCVPRASFDRLLQRFPALRRELRPGRLTRERLLAPQLSWQTSDEPTLLLRRRHWYALLRTLPIPTLILLGLTVAAWLLRQAQLLTGALGTALLVGTLPAALVAWLYLDWHNDFYLVTAKRLLHEEKVILLHQTWQEVPLNRISQTVVTRDFIGSLLGFGTLYVETASLRGTMVLDYLPNPEDFQWLISRQACRLESAHLNERRETIRDLLLRQIRGSAPDSEPAKALSPSPTPAYTATTSDVLFPLARTDRSRLVWRPHWIFLLRRALAPSVSLAATTSLVALSLLGLPSFGRLPLFLAALGLWVVSLVWLWWRAVDWANDIYILTDRLIIDIERRPLFLSEKRRQATLDMIQNVSLEKTGILMALLNYGDVVIHTAGAGGELTFAGVSDPMGVQREIFRRVERYRESRQRQQEERHRGEFSQWFSVYDELQSHPPSPRRQGPPFP